MKTKVKLFERRRRKDLSHQCGIYAIYAGKHIYVSSSEDLSRRLTEHRMTIPTGKKGCKILNDLFKNVSKDDFYYVILEFCTPEERLQKEKYYISILNADCNIAKDPQNPVTHSNKIFQYSIDGDYLTEFPSITEAARVIGGSEGNISMAVSQRRYAYNSLWAFVKHDKYPYKPKTKLKNKRVYMFNNSAELIKMFNSISDAANFLMGIFPKYTNFDSLCNSISRHCARKLWHNFNGYFFSFNEAIYIPKEHE